MAAGPQVKDAAQAGAGTDPMEPAWPHKCPHTSSQQGWQATGTMHKSPAPREVAACPPGATGRPQMSYGERGHPGIPPSLSHTTKSPVPSVPRSKPHLSPLYKRASGGKALVPLMPPSGDGGTCPRGAGGLCAAGAGAGWGQCNLSNTPKPPQEAPGPPWGGQLLALGGRGPL